MKKKQENFGRDARFCVSTAGKIRQIQPLAPDPEAIAECARIIRAGGVAVFPTRCLYGLGADALNTDAVNRLFEIKERPHEKAILVLISDKKELSALVSEIPKTAIRIMDKFWPGKITIIFKAKENLPANLTAGTGKIGVRLCGHPAAWALMKAVGGPVTGTSANLAGHPGCSQIADLDAEIAEQVNLILDAGKLDGGAGSSIVDVTGDAPTVLREGVIPATDIFGALDGGAGSSIVDVTGDAPTVLREGVIPATDIFGALL